MGSHGYCRSFSLLAHMNVMTLVRPHAMACTLISIIMAPTVGKLAGVMAHFFVAVVSLTFTPVGAVGGVFMAQLTAGAMSWVSSPRIESACCWSSSRSLLLSFA